MNTLTFDDRDEDLRQQGIVFWNQKTSPRVGDFVEFPDGTLTRIAVLYSDRFQITTPPTGGSFYFAWWYCSHSGGCGEAFPLSDLEYTGQLREGPVWFFHHNVVGAHRGVTCTIPCRIYRLVPQT